PLHPRIMEGSDSGHPITVSPGSNSQSVSFDKLARNVAGRVSIIAAELKEQTDKEQDKIAEAARTE
ncbi:MAG: chromosome partitioning protein, partial [Candidatus Eiseniibacteriota bacterium]